MGSLEDIAVPVEPGKLVETMSYQFRKNKINPLPEGFYGNIKRKDLRNEIYMLGENKAHILLSIGTAEYE